MKITRNSTWEPNHVLVMGDPGSGKSTLAAQLARAGFNLIWISMDNGHRVLEKLPDEALARIELVRLPDTRDYPIAVDTFREIMKMKPASICDTHGKVNCSVCRAAAAGGNQSATFTNINLGTVDRNTVVVIDNLSQLSDSYMSLITKGKPVDYKLQLDDWGSLRFHLFKALGDIQQAPFNIVAICHVTIEEDTEKTKKIFPMVGSSTTAPKVAGYFDHVVFTNIINKKHRAGSSTTYQANVITKSRTDVEIEKLEAPTLVPFFSGLIPKEPQYGAELAAKVLAPEPKVASVPSDNVVPLTQPGSSGTVAPTTLEEAPVVSTEPAAGAATGMTAPASSDPTMSQADKARALLETFKRKK